MLRNGNKRFYEGPYKYRGLEDACCSIAAAGRGQGRWVVTIGLGANRLPPSLTQAIYPPAIEVALIASNPTGQVAIWWGGILYGRSMAWAANSCLVRAGYYFEPQVTSDQKQVTIKNVIIPAWEKVYGVRRKDGKKKCKPRRRRLERPTEAPEEIARRKLLRDQRLPKLPDINFVEM
jgi:hypothetical protein